MTEQIDPKKLYTEEETRQLLGNIGKTKLWQYRQANCIAPYRRRPTMYLGIEIQRAIEKVTAMNRAEREPMDYEMSDYGL